MDVNVNFSSDISMLRDLHNLVHEGHFSYNEREEAEKAAKTVAQLIRIKAETQIAMLEDAKKRIVVGQVTPAVLEDVK